MCPYSVCEVVCECVVHVCLFVCEVWCGVCLHLCVRVCVHMCSVCVCLSVPVLCLSRRLRECGYMHGNVRGFVCVCLHVSG